MLYKCSLNNNNSTNDNTSVHEPFVGNAMENFS